MKILFLPKYHEEGPSSRYRTFKYLKYFENKETEFKVLPLMSNGYVTNLYKGMGKIKKIIYILKSYINRGIYIFLNKKKYDLFIIEKELFPYIPYKIEKLFLFNLNYTLDFDDAIFGKYRKMTFLKKKIDFLSRKSILTTVGNHWYFKTIDSNKLKYLPTVIDLDDYKLKNTEKNKKNIDIVWIGTPQNIRYLKKLEKVFLKLSKEFNFKLKIIGANYKCEGINIICLPWNKEREFEYLNSSDIGIMPLEKEYWENGKCGFKLIQYMASGLACIGDNLPANKEIINSNKVGFIVDSIEEWEEKLRLLLINKELRNNIGKAARKRIELHYSYQVWGDRYFKDIKKLIINKVE